MATNDQTAQVMETAGDNGSAVCTFIKPKQRKGNMRKRSGEEFAKDDATPTVAAVSNLKKKEIGNPLVQSTREFKKAKEDLSYSSSGTAASTVSADQFATATLQTETEHDRDETAIRKRSEEIQKKIMSGELAEEVYRGLNSYTDYLEKKDKSGVAKGTGIRAGPIRASLYHRTITRTDYQPDICKDYKETGYCGYGDSCKFMHDRGDYKSGWQLDREWDEEQETKKKQAQLAEMLGDEAVEQEEDKSDDVPFACSLCRRAFKDPVKTKCKHFFCERCILKQPKCEICGQKTGGTFSYPTQAELEKLEKAKIRAIETGKILANGDPVPEPAEDEEQPLPDA